MADCLAVSGCITALLISWFAMLKARNTRCDLQRIQVIPPMLEALHMHQRLLQEQQCLWALTQVPRLVLHHAAAGLPHIAYEEQFSERLRAHQALRTEMYRREQQARHGQEKP